MEWDRERARLISTVEALEVRVNAAVK
jgi:hypothetical protein